MSTGKLLSHLAPLTPSASDSPWLSSCSQRAAWCSYFDDANAILFLAPISCFDELLAEDRRVNRLEDSFLLWKGIIQSKLLAKCIIVRTSLPLRCQSPSVN